MNTISFSVHCVNCRCRAIATAQIHVQYDVEGVGQGPSVHQIFAFHVQVVSDLSLVQMDFSALQWCPEPDNSFALLGKVG